MYPIFVHNYTLHILDGWMDFLSKPLSLYNSQIVFQNNIYKRKTNIINSAWAAAGMELYPQSY